MKLFGSKRVLTVISTLALALILASSSPMPGQTPKPDLFSRSTMQQTDLPGATVWLGKPVQITSGLAWQMFWPNYMGIHAFSHLTPTLARFPKGELIATYTLDSDTQSNPVFSSAYQISRDGGATWGRRYSMIMQHVNMIFLPKPNDSLLAVASEFFEATPG